MRIATSSLNRQAVNTILEQQSRLADLQNQLARGIKLTRGGDDPAAIGSAVRLDDALAGLERDRSNLSGVRTRLNLEESTLQQATEVLQRVRELSVQGANATQSVESRQQIAAEITARLDELVALANAGDGSGRYLFAGTRDSSPPFAVDGSTVLYGGDDATRSVGVGDGQLVRDGDAGSAVFLRVPGGNGEFRVSAGANTGTAKVTRSQIIDPAAWDAQSYTLNFAAGGYTVLDAGGGPVASGSYEAGATISFAGLAITVDGTPADGDEFQIDPSRSTSLFAIVANIASALEDPGDDAATDARRHVAMQTGLAELDQAVGHLLGVRSSVGARLGTLDQSEARMDAVGVELQSALSDLRDLDYAEASGRLALQLTGLQAAQQSYLRVQGLSLFNLLG